MKLLFKFLLLLVWMAVTLILAISVVGIFMIWIADGEAEWFDIPSKIINYES